MSAQCTWAMCGSMGTCNRILLVSIWLKHMNAARIWVILLPWLTHGEIAHENLSEVTKFCNNVYQCMLFNRMNCCQFEITLQLFLKCPTDSDSGLFKMTAWHNISHVLLARSTMTQFTKAHKSLAIDELNCFKLISTLVKLYICF